VSIGRRDVTFRNQTVPLSRKPTPPLPQEPAFVLSIILSLSLSFALSYSFSLLLFLSLSLSLSLSLVLSFSLSLSLPVADVPFNRLPPPFGSSVMRGSANLRRGLPPFFCNLGRSVGRRDHGYVKDGRGGDSRRKENQNEKARGIPRSLARSFARSLARSRARGGSGRGLTAEREDRE